MARLSEYSRSKNGKRGLPPFCPPIEEWGEACKIYPNNLQICRYFGISQETFYAFIDRERAKEEGGKKSEYLETLTKNRQKTRKLIANAYYNKILDGDNSSIIFGMKAYNGVVEEKDVMLLNIKTQELQLKQKAFLTTLADKFKLSAQELEDFAAKYFTNLSDRSE